MLFSFVDFGNCSFQTLSHVPFHIRFNVVKCFSPFRNRSFRTAFSYLSGMIVLNFHLFIFIFYCVLNHFSSTMNFWISRFLELCQFKIWRTMTTADRNKPNTLKELKTSICNSLWSIILFLFFTWTWMWEICLNFVLKYTKIR